MSAFGRRLFARYVNDSRSWQAGGYLSNAWTCDGWWRFDVGRRPGSPLRLLAQMCFDIHLMHLFRGVFALKRFDH